jgi:Ca2+-binding EF-hand superfamily protein
MKATTIAIVLLTAGFNHVQAEPTLGQGKLTRFLKIFDLDGNGSISLDEFKFEFRRHVE